MSFKVCLQTMKSKNRLLLLFLHRKWVFCMNLKKACVLQSLLTTPFVCQQCFLFVNWWFFRSIYLELCSVIWNKVTRLCALSLKLICCIDTWNWYTHCVTESYRKTERTHGQNIARSCASCCSTVSLHSCTEWANFFGRFRSLAEGEGRAGRRKMKREVLVIVLSLHCLTYAVKSNGNGW